MELSYGNDRILKRTILQVLTQICGPISFSLFARICHCLLIAKSYVQSQSGKDGDDIDKNQVGTERNGKASTALQMIGDYNVASNTRNESNEKRALSAMIENSVETSEAPQ